MQMVKGMTRRIVEVRQTNSSFFDRAVFYCRTDLPRGVTESTLAQEAQRIIARMTREPAGLFPQTLPAKGKRVRPADIFRVLVSAAAGVLGTVLFLRLH